MISDLVKFDIVAYNVLGCSLIVIAEHVGVPRRRFWFPFLAGVATALSLWLWPPESARADALWDWYFGPGSARCDQIGALPEMAVAIGNKLPIASAKTPQILAWFTAHPQYQEEIDRQRKFVEQTCRR